MRLEELLLFHLDSADSIDFAHAVHAIYALFELWVQILGEIGNSLPFVIHSVRTHGLVAFVESATLDGFNIHIWVEGGVENDRIGEALSLSWFLVFLAGFLFLDEGKLLPGLFQHFWCLNLIDEWPFYLF